MYDTLEQLLEEIGTYVGGNLFPSGFDPIGIGVLDGEFLSYNLSSHLRKSLSNPDDMS